MKEMQVNKELVFPTGSRLTHHEREPITELGDEVRHPGRQSVLHFPPGVSRAQRQKVQVIGILDDLPRPARLPVRKGGRAPCPQRWSGSLSAKVVGKLFGRGG